MFSFVKLLIEVTVKYLKMYMGLILCISIRHNRLTYTITPVHFPLSTYAFLKLFYLYVCFLTPSQKTKFQVGCSFAMFTEIVTGR